MATELGQAYVQIMPSARGIKGSIEGVLNNEIGSSGTALGGKLGKMMALGAAAAVAAAGIGKLVGSAIAEGAKVQQSEGGIETLFKGSAGIVKKNAQQAFKTVGISANEYMEQVTSFSASLLQSLGGDTKKAAKVSDMAMKDMGDNANKFGTDMGSIQQAYQGFAKQNYTMLDNLKLGYGGTKSEMERLLSDASKLTGQKYDINNLSDVYTAIHAIQQNLGVTGTTAKEASTTFTGSMNAMKAAWQTLLGNMATGQNLQPALEGLVTSAWTFFTGNLLPMVGTILSSLANLIINNIDKVPSLIDGLGQKLLAKGPTVLNAGLVLISKLAIAIIKATPKILSALGVLLLRAVAALLKGAGKFLSIGAKFIGSLVSGVKARANAFIDNCGGLAGKALRAIRSGLPGFKELGGDIVRGMISGVKNLVGNFGQAIKDMVRSGLRAGKKESKTGSPSRLFRDELGKWIPLGAAVGVRKYTSAFEESVSDMIANTIPTAQRQLQTISIGNNTAAGLSDSIVSGISTIAGGFNRGQQVIQVNASLYPNSTVAGKAVVKLEDEWGGKLNGNR